MEPAIVGAVGGPASPLAYLLPTITCMLSVAKNSGPKSYEGYQILRITNITTPTNFQLLEEMYQTDVLYDFLTRPSLSQEETDVMLCPEQVESVKRLFKELHMGYEVLVEDVQKKIQEELGANSNALRSGNDTDTDEGIGGMSWSAFQRLDTIHAWMDGMADKYPALVKVEEYGKSSEGRAMKVLKITTGGGPGTKPAVWIDGGIHAREWISPATVTFIANQLISQAVRGGGNYRLVSSVDWYINPVLNPDGYEYTHTHDRMWRKTRSNDGSFAANVFGCLGADPNRNWNYKWGGKGTSGNPCSQIYRGPKAGSEPEVSSTQDYILGRKDDFKLFLTFHSYSQMIFRPWGYDNNVPMEDKEDLMVVARDAAKALESVHGTRYQTGSSPELLYPAAGGSEDWARGVAGIKFSYCYELRDTGKHGFILPPDQIVHTGEETFASVKAMVEGAMRFHKVPGF